MFVIKSFGTFPVIAFAKIREKKLSVYKDSKNRESKKEN